MKKIIKISLWIITAVCLLASLFVIGFMYKIKNGFPVSYESKVPVINFIPGRKAVLLFSKSTGYRHSSSIEAGKKAFIEMAERNQWLLFSTEEGGVFNAAQLANFDAVIFNNSTGRVLNDNQQKALEQYVEEGGNLIGIHGAGDNSHHWDWYEQNLAGVGFSHHPIKKQLQQTEVLLDTAADRNYSKNLPHSWAHTDEWYIFFNHPSERGFHILYEINGEKISPDGNLLWITDKNFGMGRHHPVAWYRETGKGYCFYTSIGHDAGAWQQKPFLQMLENAVGIP